MSHYEVFYRRPPKGSRYEFFAAAFAILAEDEPPLLGAPVIDVPNDADAYDARYFERYNRRAAAFLEALERSVDRTLAEAGVFPTNASPQGYEHLRAAVLRGEQLAVFTADQNRRQKLALVPKVSVVNGLYPGPLCQDIVYGIDSVLGRPGPTAIADFLNTDLPTARGLTRLNENHVYRALRARRQRLIGEHPRVRSVAALWRRLMLVEHQQLLDRVAMLLSLYWKARVHAELRHYQGAALARAMHDRIDLIDHIDREEFRQAAA